MRRLLALLLCLMLLPCTALAADDTVLVVIEEGSGFTVAENGCASCRAKMPYSP